MTTDGFSLAAVIMMMFPMMYFLIVTPTFFLMKFDDPVVTWLFRKLVNLYFLSVAICCVLGVTAFAVAGRLAIASGIALIAACAVAARRWFLRQMDAELRARDAGDIDAIRRLRRLQVGGMVYNAAQLVGVFVSIPFVFVAVT